MAQTDPPSPPHGWPIPAGANLKAANADSVTPVPPPKSAIPTTRTVLSAGLVTGITAALVCLALRILAWIFRAQFLIAPMPGSSETLEPVPWLGVILIPFAAAMIGALVAAAFLGVRYGRGLVLLLGTLVALVSLAGPLLQPEAVTWPTRIWLVVMHVATWLIVVPQVARIIGDSDPRITASFRDDTAETPANYQS
ncbi:MAG: hypothetical protein K0U64_09070 [Actinomycetia bacterium]|nr:hypothetical protein [Actinomycetes bacterium]